MENFEELRHQINGTTTFLIQPELRFFNHHNDNKMHDLPTLILQFEIFMVEDLWLKQHDQPSQLIYKPEYHHTYTLSFDVKLCHSQYTSHDVLFSILQHPRINRGENDPVIKQMTSRLHKLIEDNGMNKNCQYLEMCVDMNVKLEYIWDERIPLGPPPPLNGEIVIGRMVPASKISIMELPDRMEIDDDQGLKDVDCVICLQQLEEGGGGNIVCMPCSHMFHRRCITTWLDKSHYCPICRYDMPTS